MSRSSSDWDSEILALRASIAATRVEVALMRLQLAWKRYDPNQPRVPAGSPEGGEWTAGDGGRFARFLREGPREAYAQLRPRTGFRTINGRLTYATPAQEARLDVSAAQANALTREVHRRDPGWRPEPAIHQGVEGQIAANQAAARQAAERLRELGREPPGPRPLADVLMPGGRPVGRREGRAGAGVRTVTRSEFRELLEAVTPGAQVMTSPQRYKGEWFRRPDGGVFGIRRSDGSGITLDIIVSPSPLIHSNMRVHQK
jgi:hypothetical protein